VFILRSKISDCLKIETHFVRKYFCQKSILKYAKVVQSWETIGIRAATPGTHACFILRPEYKKFMVVNNQKIDMGIGGSPPGRVLQRVLPNRITRTVCFYCWFYDIFQALRRGSQWPCIGLEFKIVRSFHTLPSNIVLTLCLELSRKPFFPLNNKCSLVLVNNWLVSTASVMSALIDSKHEMSLAALLKRIEKLSVFPSSTSYSSVFLTSPLREDEQRTRGKVTGRWGNVVLSVINGSDGRPRHVPCKLPLILVRNPVKLPLLVSMRSDWCSRYL